MALIYTKLTDKTTVFAPGEGGGRKLDFDAWTQIRFGGFFSAIAATGSNDNNTNETLVPSATIDRVTFGLKDDDQTTFPGEAGSLFIGIRDGESDVRSVATSGIGGQSGIWKPVGYHDTTEVLGSSISPGGAGNVRMGSATASGASAYCGFIGVRIDISNLGTSSQSLVFRMATLENIAGTDYSETALLTNLQNLLIDGLGSQSIAWNDGASARAIPDCLWIRTPLVSNSIRISCMRAVRYAP